MVNCFSLGLVVMMLSVFVVVLWLCMVFCGLWFSLMCLVLKNIEFMLCGCGM